jgi:four helix bundle protein
VASIRRFEDVEAWQLARAFVKLIYSVSDRGGFAKDYGLRDQIRRSAVSVMANIAEGLERNGNQEFTQHLYVAKASSGEVRSHLYVALDQGYISAEEFDMLYEQSAAISRKIHGLIASLQKSAYRGAKYAGRKLGCRRNRTLEP